MAAAAKLDVQKLACAGSVYLASRFNTFNQYARARKQWAGGGTAPQFSRVRLCAKLKSIFASAQANICASFIRAYAQN
jgi:hypothetical protein